jgi:hypothetical protein
MLTSHLRTQQVSTTNERIDLLGENNNNKKKQKQKRQNTQGPKTRSKE